MSLQCPRQAGNLESPDMRFFGTISRRTCILGGLACAGLLGIAGGCGYSSNDEYFRIRSIVVQATPGDGSMIASTDGRSGPVGNSRAAMVLNRPRGSASDQRVSLE